MSDSAEHKDPVTPAREDDGTDSRCRRMENALQPAPRILFKRDEWP
ncbi:MAG TPA: hypothetical protein VF885_05910 [Arthrobacter sp.]